MKMEKCEIWKDRFCNECHKQDDVREVYMGDNVIALCSECREEVSKLLSNKMEIKDYQNKSTRTINHDLTSEQLISNMVFGANGEIGEVTDILKKHLYQGHELDKEHLKEELGDVMFYLVNLATTLNIDMREVLQMNVDKLLKRYPDGFDKDKSINREEKG